MKYGDEMWNSIITGACVTHIYAALYVIRNHFDRFKRDARARRGMHKASRDNTFHGVRVFNGDAFDGTNSK